MLASAPRSSRLTLSPLSLRRKQTSLSRRCSTTTLTRSKPRAAACTLSASDSPPVTTAVPALRPTSFRPYVGGNHPSRSRSTATSKPLPTSAGNRRPTLRRHHDPFERRGRLRRAFFVSCNGTRGVFVNLTSACGLGIFLSAAQGRYKRYGSLPAPAAAPSVLRLPPPQRRAPDGPVFSFGVSVRLWPTFACNEHWRKRGLGAFFSLASANLGACCVPERL
eukprot:6185381-Pleurochrysis_carterae.AAC.1